MAQDGNLVDFIGPERTHASCYPLNSPRDRKPRLARESCGIDRGLLLVLLLAGAVVVPRSFLIARAHSESYDDDYHLKRGLLFLTRGLSASEVDLERPAAGRGPDRTADAGDEPARRTRPADDRLYDAPGRAETIAIRTAMWNSMLFLGFLAVVCCVVSTDVRLALGRLGRGDCS